jgi:hypothetical protein
MARSPAVREVGSTGCESMTGNIRPCAGRTTRPLGPERRTTMSYGVYKLRGGLCRLRNGQFTKCSGGRKHRRSRGADRCFSRNAPASCFLRKR